MYVLKHTNKKCTLVFNNWIERKRFIPILSSENSRRQSSHFLSTPVYPDVSVFILWTLTRKFLTNNFTWKNNNENCLQMTVSVM
jgi:hypothetical protein